MPKKKQVNEDLMEELNKLPKPVPTVVNVILDQSGSMESVRQSTIDSFNEYLNGLKKNGKNIRMSLTLFDSDNVEQRYIAEKLNDIDPLTEDTFVPGAMTPLYDAVVMTVRDARRELKKKYKKYASVVVIITDGLENASKEFNAEDFTKLKEELEGEKNWTFVFMGSNQDAWETASQWGFSKNNTMTWDFNSQGVENAYRSLSDATVAYTAQVSASGGTELNTANFFNQKKNETKSAK